MNFPIDPASAAALAARGLRFDLVDTSDREQFRRWLDADSRGFHASRFSDETAAQYMDGTADRRTTGVWDDSGADAPTPVATVNSWRAALTVPGEREVDGWAISSVTVASTHRRRGIARALLEAELRNAVADGSPLAMLTVSESTIYGRFGFAPATLSADYEIDTRKARWIGRAATGRVQFVPLRQLREEAPAIIERKRLATPGEITVWSHLWDRTFGLSTDDKALADRIRAIRYDDVDGTPQGYALYTLTENPHDYSKHTANVISLVSVTDDAYAGLWSYLLELDLTTTIKVALRSTDEPLRFSVSDFRAVRSVDVRDHLWIRLLDVPAALSARTYAAPLNLVVEVTDELGFTAGRYQLHTHGTTRVSDDPALTLSVATLSALYLGGFSALTLQRAGLITEHVPGAVSSLDRAFRSAVTPHLPVWF